VTLAILQYCNRGRFWLDDKRYRVSALALVVLQDELEGIRAGNQTGISDTAVLAALPATGNAAGYKNLAPEPILA
jgi:hypothetical protein